MHNFTEDIRQEAKLSGYRPAITQGDFEDSQWKVAKGQIVYLH